MEIFDYDNILLLPRKCRVESRSECDAGVELGGRKFRLPVVPANMKTVLWQRWAVLIMPALAGVWLGHRLARRVPAARLRQTLCALLVVSGTVLAARALG